jgi:hypothetical protein
MAKWDSSLIDEKTRAQIEKHFEGLQKKSKIGKPATLSEILQGPNTPVATATGKPKNKKLHRGLLKPMWLVSLLHPFAAHLKDWEQGVLVDCGEPWSEEAIHLAVERGPHPTTRTADAIELVHEDIDYQVKAGFSEIVWWDEIKHNLPTNFKIFPMEVVPQPYRRGRIILDLSFPV